MLRRRQTLGLTTALAAGLVAVGSASFAACGGSDGDASDDSATGGGDGGEGEHVAGPQTCFPPTGLENPKTIADLVALLNTLPKPVSVGCFLQTLPRPLVVELSSDQSSFQPAFGPASPRVIIHVGELTVTVVPEGAGANVIEMSESRGGDFSTKAELPFPITVGILSGDPFLRVQDNQDATKCSVCHTNETLDTTIQEGRAFKSKVLHPLPQYVVPLEEFAKQYGWCVPEDEPGRCEILDGLFGYGEVVAYQP